MKIKLLAIDLDGTLLNNGSFISDTNLKGIRDAISNDVEVVICTGRVFNEIPLSVQSIEGINYYITSNGAKIFDKNKTIIYKDTLPKNISDELMSIIKEYDCMLDLYLSGNGYFQKLSDDLISNFKIDNDLILYLNKYRTFVEDIHQFYSEQKEELEKINLFFINSQQRDELIEDLWQLKTSAQITYSMTNNLEINSPSCTKGSSLSVLAKKLGLFPVETMGIGDSNNDISMLRYVGTSVAMGNAPNFVKSYANYETDTCENNGVAKAIDKFILKH